MIKLMILILCGILGIVFPINLETSFWVLGQQLPMQKPNSADQSSPNLTMSEMSNATSIQSNSTS